MIYAHRLTYSEFATSKEAVCDLQGRMIGGPDRKQDPPIQRWAEWQRAVQSADRAGKSVQNVIDYFQATKHLKAPPKEGDLNILQTAPLKKELIEDAVLVEDKQIIIAPSKFPNPPRFTWSFTALNEFLTCPAQWSAKRFYKTIKDVPGEAMLWGNLVHATAEHYLKQQIGLIHKAGEIHTDCLPLVQKYCEAFLRSGADLFVEREFCYTRQFKACDWRDWDHVWVRGKGDVLARKNEKLSIIDWKTGKFKEDFLQLELFAVLAALDPEFKDIQEFDPKFIFLKEADPKKAILSLPAPIKRSELRPVLDKIIAIVRRMEEAWASETFIAKKNGLCKNWCANKTCPHCG